jgi:hypothetical protein
MDMTQNEISIGIYPDMSPRADLTQNKKQKTKNKKQKTKNKKQKTKKL